MELIVQSHEKQRFSQARLCRHIALDPPAAPCGKSPDVLEFGTQLVDRTAVCSPLGNLLVEPKLLHKGTL